MYQNLYLNKIGYNEYNVHLWDSEFGYKCFEWKKKAFVPSKRGEYNTLDGRNAEKTTYWTKDDETFESDLSPETALLIELYGESDKSPEYQRLFVFDIEVSMEGELPDADTANNEITSIAYYDGVVDEYGVFILDEYNELPDDIDSDYKVYRCDNEEQLLQRFLNKWRECSPTVVTGWSIDYFDVPYLYNRLERLFDEQTASKLSPIGEVYWNKRKERYFIAGVSCLDYIQIYKNFTFSELSNYRLDTVAKKELGYGKIEYEGNLDDLKENDIEKFVEYNVVDVKIVKELEDKLEFIDQAIDICHIGHVQYEDIYHSSKFLEGAIITFLRRNGNRVANDKTFDNKDTSFAGGYVKEPEPGRYDYIFDLDLTSMYPSIIMSLNISPETKVAKIRDWDYKEYKKGERDSYLIYLYDDDEQLEFDRDGLEELFDETEYTISSNGIMYRTDVDGVIPSILRDWFETRSEYKELMKKHGNEGNEDKEEFYDKKQHIQKILLNSIYGCLGLRGWRWYDIDNALAVTSVGQEVIKFSSQMANSFYNKKLDTDKDWVIYTDTDSTFLSAVPIIKHMYPDIDTNDEELMCSKISEVAQDVQDYINRSYDVMARNMYNIHGNHRFEIKQENIARRAIWVAKKRYVQKIIWEKGVPKDELDVKGLDVVRSDFPKEFKDFMKEVMNDLLNGVDKDIIDKKIVNFKNDLENKDILEISRPTGVKGLKKYKKNDGNVGTVKKGTPIHTRSALYYNDFLKIKELEKKYEPIKNGEKIMWAYVKQNPYGMDVMGFKGNNDPDEVMEFLEKYFDYDKMFEKVLKKKLLDFYNALDWTSFEGVNLESEKFFSF